MDVSHRKIALTGFVVGCLIALTGLILGYPNFALGLLFSLPLAVLNFKAIDKTLQFAFSFSMPGVIKAVAFALYNLRFAALIIIMFWVITKMDFSFGVGTFAGFLIAKVALGGEILRQEKQNSESE